MTYCIRLRMDAPGGNSYNFPPAHTSPVGREMAGATCTLIPYLLGELSTTPSWKALRHHSPVSLLNILKNLFFKPVTHLGWVP